MKNKQEELWITNINRFQDITLGDLKLTVRRGQSINLLAKKKNGLSLYNLTKKQIDDSFKNGSLFHKSLHIKRRDVAPEVFISKIEVSPLLDVSSLRSVRKAPEIEVIDFPDLDLKETSAEEYAAEVAEMDSLDRAPLLAVDPMFKNINNDE